VKIEIGKIWRQLHGNNKAILNVLWEDEKRDIERNKEEEYYETMESEWEESNYKDNSMCICAT